MTDKPNVLLILADQLGLNHCGFGGAAQARTPHLDQLAADGVNFSNAVSSMPVCSAFRASLLTGKYTTSTGMVINELRLNPRHTSLAHSLSAAGYQTAYVGKWHLYANRLGDHENPDNSFIPPGPDRLGFDGYWAAYNFHHDYYDTYYHRDTPEKIHYGAGVYEPDAQTDLMIDWLDNRRDTDTPFFAMLSYGTPHDPWDDGNVPEDFRALFDEKDFPHPGNYRDENDPYADNWGRITPEDRLLLPRWRRNYYAMTANLDANVGRLLDALARMRLDDNTVVVFASDHGEMFGAHGRRNKNIFYEEAIRIPLLFRWPTGIRSGTVSDACLSSVDIMPTILGMLGQPIPAGVEGMDCSALARGEDGAEPEAAFLQNTGACAIWEDGYEWRGLRNKRYTYARYLRDNSEYLFDNTVDPYQLSNLASDRDHIGILQIFREALRRKMHSVNDSFAPSTWYRDNWTKDRVITV